MSIYLRVEFFSSMDRKLEEELDRKLEEEWGRKLEEECGYDGELTHEIWIEFVNGLQFVKGCRYDHFGTVIEFSNEASKTWFLMRWS